MTIGFSPTSPAFKGVIMSTGETATERQRKKEKLEKKLTYQNITYKELTEPSHDSPGITYFVTGQHLNLLNKNDNIFNKIAIIKKEVTSVN